MKDQIETSEPRIKFVAGDSGEARKTATVHSCKTLAAMVTDDTTTTNRRLKTEKKIKPF
jgi:hypothetical protein